eukprot:SAG31_NODE_12459_length_940_cov_1.161712_1_plen_178_part_01
MCKNCSEEGFLGNSETVWAVEGQLPQHLVALGDNVKTSSEDEDEDEDDDEDSDDIDLDDPLSDAEIPSYGTYYGKIEYSDGSSFWGQFLDGNELFGTILKPNGTGAGKYVKFEKEIPLRILWEDVDWEIARTAVRKAQAAEKSRTGVDITDILIADTPLLKKNQPSRASQGAHRAHTC